jgi:hypothetical protein
MGARNQSISKRGDFAGNATHDAAETNAAHAALQAASELAERIGPISAAVVLLDSACTLIEGGRGMQPVVAIVRAVAAKLRARCKASA